MVIRYTNSTCRVPHRSSSCLLARPQGARRKVGVEHRSPLGGWTRFLQKTRRLKRRSMLPSTSFSLSKIAMRPGFADFGNRMQFHITTLFTKASERSAPSFPSRQSHICCTRKMNGHLQQAIDRVRCVDGVHQFVLYCAVPENAHISSQSDR